MEAQGRHSREQGAPDWTRITVTTFASLSAALRERTHLLLRSRRRSGGLGIRSLVTGRASGTARTLGPWLAGSGRALQTTPAHKSCAAPHHWHEPAHSPTTERRAARDAAHHTTQHHTYRETRTHTRTRTPKKCIHTNRHTDGETAAIPGVKESRGRGRDPKQGQCGVGVADYLRSFWPWWADACL